jgi:hypothetical protein
MSLFSDTPSRKIDRTSSVHPGAIRGAPLPLLALSIPATNDPRMHALLPVRVQLPDRLPRVSWVFGVGRSGWFSATGPSIRPIFTSALPLVRSINCFRCTSSRAAAEISVFLGSGAPGSSGACGAKEDIPRHLQVLWCAYFYARVLEMSSKYNVGITIDSGRNLLGTPYTGQELGLRTRMFTRLLFYVPSSS